MLLFLDAISLPVSRRGYAGGRGAGAVLTELGPHVTTYRPPRGGPADVARRRWTDGRGFTRTPTGR